MTATAARPAETKELTYADGNPPDKVQFFDAKLILKPDFFFSIRGRLKGNPPQAHE